MTDNSQIFNFYKHTNSKLEIEPNLAQTKEILNKAGLDERVSIYSKSAGRSGDLYVIDKSLFMFNEEPSFLTASGPDGRFAQIYSLVMNSTNGWAQYLSVILKGPFDQKISSYFDELNFAPRHSYLAKNDRVVTPNYGEQLLWLDDLLDVKLPF